MVSEMAFARVGGAGEQALLDVDHVREALQYSTTPGTSTTRPMLAPQRQTNTPTLGSSCVVSRSSGIDALLGQQAAARLQQPRHLRAGAAGGIDRFRYIHRTLERAADEYARPAGLDRIVGIGLAEPVCTQFDAEDPGEFLRVLGRIDAHRQHHQFEFLFLDALRRRVADADVLGDGILGPDRYVAADELDAGQARRALIEALESLP